MIDTHVHFWDYNLNIHAWIHNGQREDLKRSFMLADYLREYPKPETIVTIEASDDKYTLQEVEWIKQHIVNNIDHIKIKHMAYIDVLQPRENFSEQLLLFDIYPFVCGFRSILLNTIDIAHFKNNLTMLKDKNYIFDCQMHPHQLLKIRDIICDSGVSCVIDHAGLPNLTTHKQEWLAMLQAYATTGVYFKLTENNPEMIDGLLQYIPKDKILLGSNYPINIQNLSLFPKELIEHSNLNARKLFNF